MPSGSISITRCREPLASYHLARHAEFGDYIPPSTSVIMERCFAADRDDIDVADRGCDMGQRVAAQQEQRRSAATLTQADARAPRLDVGEARNRA